jgi:uncharacterized protein YhdP
MRKILKWTGIVLVDLVLLAAIVGLVAAICLPAMHENRESLPAWVQKYLAEKK